MAGVQRINSHHTHNSHNLSTMATKGPSSFASHFAARPSALSKYTDKYLFVLGSTFPGILKENKNLKYLYVVQSGVEKDEKVVSLEIAYRRQFVGADLKLVEEEEPDDVTEVRLLTSKLVCVLLEVFGTRPILPET